MTECNKPDVTMKSWKANDPSFFFQPKTEKKIKRSILTTVCNFWAKRKVNNREQWPGKNSHYYYLGFGFTTLNPKVLSMHLIIDYQGGVNKECKKENPECTYLLEMVVLTVPHGFFDY